LREGLRQFLRESTRGMSPERRARSWAGFDANFSRELGKRGYLGVTFPRKYGGADRSAFARFVVVEELLNFGAPVAAHWISERQSGPSFSNTAPRPRSSAIFPNRSRRILLLHRHERAKFGLRPRKRTPPARSATARDGVWMDRKSGPLMATDAIT